MLSAVQLIGAAETERAPKTAVAAREVERRITRSIRELVLNERMNTELKVFWEEV